MQSKPYPVHAISHSPHLLRSSLTHSLVLCLQPWGRRRPRTQPGLLAQGERRLFLPLSASSYSTPSPTPSPSPSPLSAPGPPSSQRPSPSAAALCSHPGSQWVNSRTEIPSQSADAQKTVPGRGGTALCLCPHPHPQPFPLGPGSPGGCPSACCPSPSWQRAQWGGRPQPSGNCPCAECGALGRPSPFGPLGS